MSGYIKSKRSKKDEHVEICEAVLGYPLPSNAQVHHANGIKHDNRKENLVICEDQMFHRLLHRRADALRNYGDVHALKCRFCKEWDMPDGMAIVKLKKELRAYHRECRNRYDTALRWSQQPNPSVNQYETGNY